MDKKCDSDWISVIRKSTIHHRLYTKTNKKFMLKMFPLLLPKQNFKTLLKVEMMANLYMNVYRKHVILKEI